MDRRGRLRLILGGLGAVAILAAGYAVLHKKPAKPAKSQAVSVTVARAAVQDVPISINALGAAQAWESDTILSQVNGMILKVAFTEGATVKAGQLLAQIDPATYQAALTQAQGQLKRDQAALEDAKLDLARYEKLLAEDSIARQMVDTQAALVKQDEGTVEVDEGEVANAKVNLERCRIVSPITGRAGVRLIDPGNIVAASAASTSVNSQPVTSITGAVASGSGGSSGGSSGIVVVNQIEPIAVTFAVPQGDYQRLVQLSDGFRKPLTTDALSQEGGTSLGQGQLSIADNRVDQSTGTVELKARFPNAGDKLLPGQFVNVRLMLQTLPHVITIPTSAVNQGPNGAYAYVVGTDSKVAMRPLKVALTQGATAVIASGLQAGETVVTDGQVALQAGSLVKTASTAPRPSAPAGPPPPKQARS